MREFNLEEAIKGAKLVTRDGHKVRLICHDRMDDKRHGNLIALMLGKGGQYESIIQYNATGHQINYNKDYDLMIDD